MCVCVIASLCHHCDVLSTSLPQAPPQPCAGVIKLGWINNKAHVNIIRGLYMDMWPKLKYPHITRR